MGFTDYTEAAWEVITENFPQQQKPDGTGTSERAANFDMGTRTISWGQGKKIS